MVKNINVGNLPWSAKDEELRELFAMFRANVGPAATGAAVVV